MNKSIQGMGIENACIYKYSQCGCRICEREILEALENGEMPISLTLLAALDDDMKSKAAKAALMAKVNRWTCT